MKMSDFKFTKVTKPGAELGAESSLPHLRGIPLKEPKPQIGYDETKGLFTGYGRVYSSFPHRQQDRYGRKLENREYDAVILENEYLRAEFIPSHGGKLWSLYDKKAKRELLFNNPVVRYCNLATRNAWTSGGVEFNIGEFGHHAYTCSQLFTAKTYLADGTPVLRMYEYTRIRNVVYQMDFFLPDDSKFLFCRMRIVNPNYEVVPMYWWSNAAVLKWDRGRIIVPTGEAFAHDYKNGMGVVSIPHHHGKDMSYFINNPCSDTFYNLNESKRKFMCYSDSDGYTFAHASTDRLKSRKLFVWGNGEGGKRWQEFLSGNGNDGAYIELQAGIANTQAEHIPMPPRTAWEWIEAYGALNLDSDKAHSEDYNEAIREAETVFENALPAAMLEKLLTETKDMSAAPADELLLSGSGWGALENKRREAAGEEPLPGHLDFGKIGQMQRQWMDLLNDKSFGNHNSDEVIPSWMKQREWIELMEEVTEGKDRDNWYAYLQLGCAYFANRQFRDAKAALEKSCAIDENCRNLYALACLYSTREKKEEAADIALKAAKMNKTDSSLVTETLKMLHEVKRNSEIIELVQSLEEATASLSRVRFYYTYALLRAGDINAAEKEFNRNGGIGIDDIREGEVSITSLWFELEEEKAKREGRPFDRNTAKPPRKFDFRMNVSME